MARKAMVEKEKRRRKMVKAKWEQRQALKKVILDLNVGEEEKEKARFALNKLPKNSSPIRLRNRCNVTGRSRGYLRKFQVSRLVFREAASHGYIPGVTKASW